jgi:hypothetical protein
VIGRIYISGPMTGLPDHNFPAFHQAAEVLQTMGWAVENPADRGIVIGWVWSDYLREDLRMLTYCDSIMLLPGWQQSRGAQLEVHVAKQLGLTFYYWYPGFGDMTA